MGKTLIAPEYGDVPGPLIFLAGPIQGAADWQKRAIELLAPHPGVNIASPRRPLSAEDFSEADYNAQVDWEHHHLARAAENGAILFWLAKESVHDCGRAYAQTTRFELGEAVTLCRLRGAKVVIGIEEGFTNARYIRRTLAKKAPAIPMCSTLEEACEQALRLTSSRN